MDAKVEGRGSDGSQRHRFHYAYLIVVACCAGVVPVSLCLSCMGLLFSSVAEGMQVGTGLISNYMTALMLAVAVWLPFAGRLFNRVDARVMTSASAIAVGAGLIVCSRASSPAVFFVGGGICGLGVATLLYLMGPVLVNRWFAKRAGFFVGVVTAFMGVATAILSPIIGGLLLKVGWSEVLLVMGIVGLVVSLPFTTLVIRSRPSDKGLLPCGASADGSDEGAAAGAEAGMSASQAFKTPTFVLLASLAFVLGLALYTQSMNPNYVRQLPVSASLPMLFSVVASALMVAQVIAKLVIGAAVDRAPLLVGIGATVVGIVGFAGNVLLSGSMAALIVSACCIGVFTALANVFLPAVTRRFFGVRDYSSIYSVVGTVISIAGVLQAPLLGTLLDAAGYLALEVAFAVLAAVSIVLLVALMSVGSKMAKRSVEEAAPTHAGDK